jgi:4'-phosphopantetheinyl transferase
VTVGLFRAPLDLDAHQLETFAATLSAEELARADALQAPQARRRMIADHGWRRQLLAEWLGGCSATELAFAVSEHGKPRLTGSGPHFSASRSEEVAWYAVSEQAEVGVDVERVDHDRPLEPLARRLLSSRERALYDRFGEAERADALYACWTCKEAAVKALGSGLVFPLTALEAWTTDGAPVRARGLEIRGLPAGKGRAGAVAVRAGTEERPVVAPLVELRVP